MRSVVTQPRLRWQLAAQARAHTTLPSMSHLGLCLVYLALILTRMLGKPCHIIFLAGLGLRPSPRWTEVCVGSIASHQVRWPLGLHLAPVVLGVLGLTRVTYQCLHPLSHAPCPRVVYRGSGFFLTLLAERPDSAVHDDRGTGCVLMMPREVSVACCLLPSRTVRPRTGTLGAQALLGTHSQDHLGQGMRPSDNLSALAVYLCIS